MASKKKRKLTPHQIELREQYRRERNRITSFIRRATKRGYQFPELDLRKKGKPITSKLIKKLQGITKEKLYKKATYGGEATYGEIVSGTKGRQAERKQAIERAKETRKLRQEAEKLKRETYEEDYFDYSDYYGNNDEDFTYDTNIQADTTFFDTVIISNFRAMLVSNNYQCRSIILNWLEDCISRFGTHETAIMIQTAAQNGVGLGISIMPSDKQDKVHEFLSEMLNYMEEAGEFTREQMMEAMEMEETYEPI